MEAESASAKAKCVAIAAAAALADLVCKWAAKSGGLAVDANAGAAFGLFRSSPRTVAAAGCLVLALLLLAILRAARLDFASRAGLALMAGGAAANLCERLLWGTVSDWIYLPFSAFFCRGGLRFNLADAEIGLGALIFLAASFCAQRRGA